MKRLWSIERKTLAGFTFSAAILVGIQMVTFWGNFRAKESSNWVSHTREVKENLAVFLSQIKDTQIGERGYLLSGDTKLLDPYNNSIAKLDTQLDNIAYLTKDNPSQQQAIAELKFLVKQKLDLIQQSIRNYQIPIRTAQVLEANQANLAQGKRVIDQMHEIIAQMNERENQLLTERLEVADTITRNVSVISLGAIALDFLILLSVYQIISREITQRYQTELALKLGKEQLELVINASNDGFWDWNLLTNEIYYSPRWKEMLGYKDDELPNNLQTWQSLIAPETQIISDDLAEEVINKYLAEDYISGETNRFLTTQKFHHKNGSIVTLLSRSAYLKDEEGQLIRMSGSHTDITEMNAMQLALENSNLQLGSILNSSLDGIMVFKSIRDSNGAIADFEYLLVNPLAAAIVKRTPETLIGKKLLVEMPGNRESGLFDSYMEVVETGKFLKKEFHFDHEQVSCWFQIIAVKLGDGFVVTFRDITSAKQSEQQLKMAYQQLAERVDQLRDRNTEMRRLNELSDFLQACVTVEEACAAIATIIQPLFPDCSGMVLILNTSSQRLEMVTSWGTEFSNLSFQSHQCWALRRGRVHWVDGDRQELFCQHINHQRPPMESLCIPMIAQGEILGSLYLATDTPNRLSEIKQQLASTVSEQIAMAIANLNLRESLRSQSIRDQLTGLFNRRYLEEFLPMEIHRAEREQYAIGIMMLDVDHFKQFNDTMGHEAGDMVLNLLGSFLLSTIRSSDVACRYGGEELILILPKSDLKETTQKAEEICQAIAKLKPIFQGKIINRITASLGVACYPTHGATGSAVIQSADAALYRAKALGRNQVITAPYPELSSELTLIT